jgi:hypothetical protein
LYYLRMVGGRGIEPLLSRCKRESLPLQQPPVNKSRIRRLYNI